MPTDKNKIRILLTVPHLSSTASPYREMMALARYLPKDQFQLTICSLRIDGFAETSPLLEDLGCRVIVARFRPRGRRFSHFWASLKDQKLIAQYGPFDLQHSLDFTNSPLEALFCKAQFRDFIYSQRNLGYDGSRIGIWLKVCLAQKVVAASEAAMQLLFSLGASPAKVMKIPLGIDRYQGNPETSASGNGAPSLLSVGHIQPIKRQKDAIRTLEDLLPEFPDMNLLIAGQSYDPSYYEELQSLVAARGLDQRVHFLGKRNDVLSLMKTSTALLLCSETEAFPWVVLEAMSAGLPVVSSDSGGAKEIITHGLNGALVPVGDIDGYARALRQIIVDPGWAASLANNAYDLISTKYSVDAMVSKHAEMYQSLIMK